MIKRLCALAALALGMFVCFFETPAARAEGPAVDKSLPYWNTGLSFDERAWDLVSRLTLEEKAALLHTSADAIPRLGVGKYSYGAEALHGIVGGGFTVFPQAIAMAASWDPEMMHEIATAISDEAWGRINGDRAEKGFPPEIYLSFWSPTVNMARDPRWGRTPETYGEDPFLTGAIGKAFVTGMQGDDPKYIKVVSTPKHYVANNEDNTRDWCNATISERSLREYYLAGFRELVVKGRAQSIMGAYNAVNGVPCNASKMLMIDILRNEWGFDGYVTTDCGAPSNIIYKHKYAADGAEATAASLNNGVDIECGGDRIFKSYISEALDRDLMTADILDQAVFRTLRARFRLGMFDPWETLPYSKISPDVVGSPAHQELARRASRESIVLLKNDPVGAAPVLPLDKSKIKSIAVVGPAADDVRFGDYSGSPKNPPVSPLAGLQNAAGNNIEIRHIAWRSAAGDEAFVSIPKDNLRPEGSEGERGLLGRYFDDKLFKGEPAERIDPVLNIDRNKQPSDPLVPYKAFSVRWTGKLVPSARGLHRLAVRGDGAFRLYLDDKLLLEKAQSNKFRMKTGEEYDIKRMPKAEGPERRDASLTLEAGKDYEVRLEYSHARGNAVMQLEWIAPSTEGLAAQEEELKIVRESDAAIAFLGIGLEQEREGKDRDTLDLPADQTAYVQQIAAANPNTIVVLINGSPLTINQIKENVPAIVEAWYAGEQGGNAIADVLFGDYNPAGRLPLTFYKTMEELPPFDDYKISKGRTYMYTEKEPLFPFGYGLSYTKFEYSNLKIDNATPKAADTVNVSVDVKNIGPRDGDEVVQLYVHDVESSVKKPNLELKGFKRVSIKKGETKTVSIPLEISRLNYWNVVAHKFVVEPGEFEILLGASSKDIREKGTIGVGKK